MNMTGSRFQVLTFLVGMWIIFLFMVLLNGEACCTVCTPVVFLLTFLGLISLGEKYVPRINVSSDSWPDGWTIGSIALIIIIWTIFGYVAQPLWGLDLDSYNYSQQELHDRLLLICLPLCLVATLVITAIEMSHRKNALRRRRMKVVSYDHDLTRRERLYFTDSGLKRVGNVQEGDSERDYEPDFLPYCPNCGTRLTMVDDKKTAYCGKCRKYIKD